MPAPTHSRFAPPTAVGLAQSPTHMQRLSSFGNSGQIRAGGCIPKIALLGARSVEPPSGGALQLLATAWRAAVASLRQITAAATGGFAQSPHLRHSRRSIAHRVPDIRESRRSSSAYPSDRKTGYGIQQPAAQRGSALHRTLDGRGAVRAQDGTAASHRQMSLATRE